MKTQIGWFILKEDKEFYNEFETAAWYEKVMVKAGRYPVTAYDITFRNDGRMGSHCGSAYVSMDGVIVSDNFQSLFCGVPIGSVYDGTKNAGKPAKHSSHWYLYMISESVLKGEGLFELFPEYEAREDHFEYNGEQRTTHGIYRKAVD